MSSISLVDARQSDAARVATPGRSALFGLRLTFSGLLFIGVVVLVGLAALQGEANLLFLVFSLSVGLIVYSALAPWRMVRRLTIERVVPETVVAGQPFKMTYVLRNHRRWFRTWSLLIRETGVNRGDGQWPLVHVAALNPGEELRLEERALSDRRGRVHLKQIQIRSSFPFGLFSCGVTCRIPAEITVCPAVGRLRRDLWRGNPRIAAASSRERQTPDHHGQDEFFGVREYRPGDNYRSIHWRRSARTGDLVIREMAPVRATQLIVVVDPWPGLDASDHERSLKGRHGAVSVMIPEAEQVISAAATIACDGLERGQRVGLICRARVPVVIGTAGGRSHRQRVLHDLASLHPGAEEGLDALLSRIRWKSGWHARCVLLAPRFEAPHDRVVRFLNTQAEAVLALAPGQEAFDALFDLSRRPMRDRRAV